MDDTKNQQIHTQEEESDDITLEELFARLDDILRQMESGELTLDASFSLYEEGLKNLKLCNDKLDLIEKKMLILSGGAETEEF